MKLSLRSTALVLPIVFAVILVLVASAVWDLVASIEEKEQADEARYQSHLLADELRQSSDDLTRLARTYVITGDQR